MLPPNEGIGLANQCSFNPKRTKSFELMTIDRPFAATPDVSVIIPAFGRVAELEVCLSALASQTLAPERFEIIVCDDGSPEPIADSLAPALAAFGNRLNVRVIRQSNGGPGSARNCGAALARGRYLAFTDDDCRPDPEWLERLLRHFKERPNALLGGGMRTSPESDRYAHATQAIMDFVYSEQERCGDMRLFSTSNLALPERAFRELDGFSPLFRRAAGEDYDLCARWFHQGGETAYVPDAFVIHDHALTFRTYWLQHFRYGRGLLQMRRRLRQRGTRMRPGSPPLVFHLRLIAYPIARNGLRGIRTAVLVCLSQAATAAGVMSELAR